MGRALLPPLLADWWERRFRRVRFEGDFASWDAARAASTGYDSAAILERVLEAARTVRDGRAAFERDGVLHLEPAPSWTLAACLMQEAARAGGRLNVLDFGGSLASCYFQHRSLWQGAIRIRWAVVEQAMFVEAGQREFSNGELSFHSDIASAVFAAEPTVALLSGVVGWVEHPHRLLDEIVELGLPAIILDRNPIIADDRDRLTVQRVPAHIGVASYPAWLLSRPRLLGHFEEKYELRAEFEGNDRPSGPAVFRGYYFVRRGA
jgi:putative methyltransferase (TIGR04325 family)